MRGLAAACMVVVVLVWGVTFASTRELLKSFSSLEIQFLRFGLAWLALACMAAGTRRRTVTDTTDGRCSELVFAAMGLTGVAVYQFLENCAIFCTNAGNVAILMAFGPLVTAVMMRLFARDRTLGMRFVAGGSVATVGVMMVSLNGVIDLKLSMRGDLLAIGAMLSWGVYSVLLDRVNRAGVAATTAVRKAFLWALVWMLPLAVWGLTETGGQAMDGVFRVTLDAAVNRARFADPLVILNLSVLGLLASALCFVAWNKATAVFGVARATLALYLVPVVGVVFAVFVLEEPMPPLSIAGSLLVLIGVYWARN